MVIAPVAQPEVGVDGESSGQDVEENDDHSEMVSDGTHVREEDFQLHLNISQSQKNIVTA